MILDHPSQLFDRIRRQKARPALARQGGGGVAPAPVRPAPTPAADAPALTAQGFNGIPAGSVSPTQGFNGNPASSVSQIQGFGNGISAGPVSLMQGFGNGNPASSVSPIQRAGNDISAGPDSPEPAAPARPARGHALYSQVMRSHDRMGTRHL